MGFVSKLMCLFIMPIGPYVAYRKGIDAEAGYILEDVTMGKKMFLRILFFAAVKAAMLIYFGYRNSYAEIMTWELLYGGMKSYESQDIINVVLQVIPDFLLFSLCIGRSLSQLKDNYIYIALRERNVKVWLQKFSIAAFISIWLYEGAAVLIMLGVCFKQGWALPGISLIPMVLCQVMTLSVMALMCGILAWQYNESVAIYANLLLQAFPLFLVGVMYDMGGAWQMAIKCIPLNWCRFNYMMELDIQPYFMLLLSVVLAAGLYWYLKRLFKNYEPI